MPLDPDYIVLVIDGCERRICSVTHVACGNEFWINFGVEFYPKWCPYCGGEFGVFYTEKTPGLYVDQAGRPVDVGQNTEDSDGKGNGSGDEG